MQIIKAASNRAIRQ